MEQKIAALIDLSHELGREERDLAILGEGNTSVRLDAETFAVKASGSSLSTLREEDVTVCRFDALLPLLEQTQLTDLEIDQALLDSRVDSSAKKPSVEALFHAYLLTLPDVEFVGHTHAMWRGRRPAVTDCQNDIAVEHGQRPARDLHRHHDRGRPRAGAGAFRADRSAHRPDEPARHGRGAGARVRPTPPAQDQRERGLV